jgi:hypothetical protein
MPHAAQTCSGGLTDAGSIGYGFFVTTLQSGSHAFSWFTPASLMSSLDT